MGCKRIIPCLDIADGRVVKGVNFVNLRDAGDPVEVARRYDEQGADELAFLDIRASVEKRGLLYDMIEAVASQVFIPLTVGGGVNAVDDIRALLNAGADKVSINTAGVQNPDLIGEASARYGAQCIVAAIDAKKYAVDAWQVYIHGGRTPTGIDAVAVGGGGRGARRRRDPADQHGPRRRAHRFRPAPDARGGRRGRRAGHRVRRRRARCRTWSTASRKAAPTPCSPRRSSTTASSRSARRRRRWRRPGIEVRREQH